MKSAFLAWSLSFLMLLPISVSATGPVPDELIRKISDDVLKVLLADESPQVARLVEQVVLPHFNFRRMTMLAVGRDWRSASPEQQERLTDAFCRMLVRTYSNALMHYRGQTVEVRPLRNSSPDKTARVETAILQPGDHSVPVDYILEQRADGWKIFDIVIAGASLVSNYRGTFAQEVRRGGIDGLINSLEVKGRESQQPGHQG